MKGQRIALLAGLFAAAAVNCVLVQGIAGQGSKDTEEKEIMKETEFGLQTEIGSGKETDPAAETETEAESGTEADGWLLPWPKKESEDLQKILSEVERDYLKDASARGETWAVSLADPEDESCAAVNGDVSMKSASVVKVFILAAVYDRVLYPENGKEALPFKENYEGELKQLLTDMITVSDNNASNTIPERLGQGDAQKGMDVVNGFCTRYGFDGTSVGRRFLEPDPKGDNYTTANDCMRLLYCIYSGTCVNEKASGEMYDLLKRQTRTWKLPAGLEGTGAQTANKTGELAGEYGVPVLRPVHLDQRLAWIRFNHALKEPRRDRYGVHFFIDDYLVIGYNRLKQKERGWRLCRIQ